MFCAAHETTSPSETPKIPGLREYDIVASITCGVWSYLDPPRKTVLRDEVHCVFSTESCPLLKIYGLYTASSKVWQNIVESFVR